jgi:hypothetical protein
MKTVHERAEKLLHRHENGPTVLPYVSYSSTGVHAPMLKSNLSGRFSCCPSACNRKGIDLS